MTTTDAALVSLTQDGDEEAFRALYERHRPAVERVCRKWLRDPYLVEDAVQATFLKAWTALPSFQGGAELDRWLRRIAKNHCHDVWRGLARAEALGRLEDREHEHVDAASARLAGECVDRLAVETMLRNLGRRDASLLVQRHIGESSVGALASQWGLTRGAMDVALHRARLRARRLAEAEGLRSLLPLGLLRRIVAALQRLNTPAADVGATFVGICNVVLAVTLAVPNLMPAYADEGPPGNERGPVEAEITSVPAADSAVGQSLEGRQSTRPAPSHRARPPELRTEPVTTVTGPPPAEATTDGNTASTVDFDPVTVPGGGARISSKPNYEEAQRTVGVRLGTEHYEAEEQRNSSVETEIKPVYDVACTAASVGDPITYCED